MLTYSTNQIRWMHRFGNILEPIAHLLMLGAIAIALGGMVISFNRLSLEHWILYQQANWKLYAIMLMVPWGLTLLSLLAKRLSGVPARSKRRRIDLLASTATVGLIAAAMVAMAIAHNVKDENFASGLILAVISGACALGALLVGGLWLATRNSD